MTNTNITQLHKWIINTKMVTMFTLVTSCIIWPRGIFVASWLQVWSMHFQFDSIGCHSFDPGVLSLLRFPFHSIPRVSWLVCLFVLAKKHWIFSFYSSYLMQQMWKFWSFFHWNLILWDSKYILSHCEGSKNAFFMPFSWLSKWGAGLLQMIIQRRKRRNWGFQ